MLAKMLRTLFLLAMGPVLVMQAQEAPFTVKSPEIPTGVTRSAALERGGDAGAAVNAVVKQVEAAGGGTVELPATQGCIPVNTQIVLASRIALRGAGADKTCLTGGPNLGAKAVILFAGERGSKGADISISGLAIKNGTPSTSKLTDDMDGVRVDNASRVLIENLKLSSIQGDYGIVLRNVDNAMVRNNDIGDFTYAGISVYPGSHHVIIQHNNVHTATYQVAGGNAYGIVAGSTGGADLSLPYSKYVWVDDNIVRNIPIWEGLDAHGGEHLWFTNNDVANVKVGILAALASGKVGSPAISDIHVTGNKVVQGNGIPDGFGIIVGGDKPQYMLDGFWIENNTVSGFGATSSAGGPTIGAITVRFAKNGHIDNNTVTNFAQCAIMAYAQVWNAEISHNTAQDMRDAKVPRASSVIDAEAPGVWGVNVHDNTFTQRRGAYEPTYMVQQKSNVGSLSVNNNRMEGRGGFSPGGRDVMLKSSSGRAGDTTVAGRRINAGPGYWATERSGVIVTGDLREGQNKITNVQGSEGGKFWYYYFPEGMNVEIDGAGPGGSPLRTKVTGNDGTDLTIETPAARSVTNAPVRHQQAH